MNGYYPPGCSGGIEYRDMVRHVCPNPECGQTWLAGMFYELGGWFYSNDDEACCPECGTEGEIQGD